MRMAIEKVQEQFKLLWGRCIAGGSAEVLRPFLDEQIVFIGDSEKRMNHGQEAVIDYLTELIGEMSFLEVKRLHYAAQSLSPEWGMLYGVIDLGDVSIQFSMCCALLETSWSMKQMHLSYSVQEWVNGQAEDQGVCELLQAAARARREELERRQEALWDSEASYKFVLEKTSDLIFDVDMVSQEVHIDREKMMRLFGVTLSEKPDIREIYDKMVSAILPADRECFVEKFGIEGDALIALLQVDYLEQEFRIVHQEKGYLWLKITMTPIRRNGTEVRRLVANIKNIDEEKRQELEIRRRSERDPLTDLSNRGYTESGVNAYLEQQQGVGALLMVDVDNFKLVNDNLGHQAGDQVLQELGQLLRTLFRSSDIVGRIGGDEFVAFMKDTTDRHLAERKAQTINAAFRKSFAAAEGVFGISASVGIAMVRESDKYFEELLRRADRALYYQKNVGKNGYAFYEDWEMEHAEGSEVAATC